MPHTCLVKFKLSCTVYVTGFKKNTNRTFGDLRITGLKCLTYCETLVLGCNHTKFTVYLE